MALTYHEKIMLNLHVRKVRWPYMEIWQTFWWGLFWGETWDHYLPFQHKNKKTPVLITVAEGSRSFNISQNMLLLLAFDPRMTLILTLSMQP